MQGEVSDRGREYILKSTPAQWGPESSTPCGNHAFDIKARPPGTTRLLRVRGDNVSSGNVKCFDARGGEWERRREREPEENKREQGERERIGGEGKNWRRGRELEERKRAGGEGEKESRRKGKESRRGKELGENGKEQEEREREEEERERGKDDEDEIGN